MSPLSYWWAPLAVPQRPPQKSPPRRRPLHNKSRCGKAPLRHELRPKPFIPQVPKDNLGINDRTKKSCAPETAPAPLATNHPNNKGTLGPVFVRGCVTGIPKRQPEKLYRFFSGFKWQQLHSFPATEGPQRNLMDCKFFFLNYEMTAPVSFKKWR